MMSTAMLQAPYMFLSYPRSEMVIAKRLEQDLQASGLQVWRDESGIGPGSPDWEEAIRDAISHAYAVVLIASPSVVKSLYIKGELNLAKRIHPRRIYPVWVSGTEWADCVPLDFINTQYIDMRGEKYKVGLNTLVDALKKAKDRSSPSQQSAVADQQGVLSSSPPQLVPKLPFSQQFQQRQTQYSQPQPYPQQQFIRGPTLLPLVPMLYRILCNGTEQKSPEARPGLGLAPSHFTPLHKIWYGILVPPNNAPAPRGKPNRADGVFTALVILLLIGALYFIGLGTSGGVFVALVILLLIGALYFIKRGTWASMGRNSNPGTSITTSTSGSNAVHISDASQVLHISQVQSKASTVGYPISIDTTNTFTGTKADFDQHAHSHLTSPDLIVVAIDTVHKYLVIVGGSHVPLSISQYRDALQAFMNNFNTGDYTNATVAAIRSLEQSLGRG